MVSEPEMIRKVQNGDPIAFERLTLPLRPLLFSYLHRRLASREEAEDLCQDVLVNAFTRISDCPSEGSFKIWIFRLAYLQSEEVLQNKDPWSPTSLDLLQSHLLENKGASLNLQEIYQDYEEHYDIVDHINFCFTVMARGLYPRESNAVILSELFHFSLKEIGKITAESEEAVGQWVKEGSETLGDALYDRCSLARPGAACTQCQDFGRWLNGDEITEDQIKKLPFAREEKSKESFLTRIEILSDLDPLAKQTRKFHSSLMALTQQLMGEKGLDRSGRD